MPSARIQDPNGYLSVKGCPISSFGIFDYGAGQLGLPGDPNRIVKVYRPESAVSDPEALASFKGVPLINDHEMLSGFQRDKDATAPEEYGIDGVLMDVYYDAPWMRGDLKVYSREMQDALNSGKKDLSLGYSCEFELTPGVFEGQPYEVVQTNMRGNHIALVDEGRVPGARVLDGLCFDHLSFEVVRPSDKELNMSKQEQAQRAADAKARKVAKDNALAQLKALLPALAQYLGGEGGEGAVEAPAAPAEGDEGAAMGEDPAAAIEAPAVEAPQAEGGESGGELAALIAKIKDILAKLEGGEAADVEPTVEQGQPDPITDESGEGSAAGEYEGTDAVEGLQNGEEQPSVGDEEEGQGNASPGPKAGVNAMAGDAALRAFYADLATKDRLYNRLSKVVGTFDCKTMDASQVAVYGVGKLKLKCAKGQESVALDAYLNGIEAANKATKTAVQARAADANIVSSSELDAYLNGSK